MTHTNFDNCGLKGLLQNNVMWNIYANLWLCISVSCKISLRKTNLLNSHASIVSILKCEILVHGGTRKTIRGTLNMHRYYLARYISSTRNKILKTAGIKKPDLLAMVKKQLAECRWKTRWYGSRETVNERPECSLFFLLPRSWI